jgi:hypothetical protein
MTTMLSPAYAIPGAGGGTGDRNLAAAVPPPAIRFRSRGAPSPFPDWGQAAALGAVPHRRLPWLPAEVCQVDPTGDEHPLRSLSGVTGRLAHRFSLPVWVGMWGLLGLAHHRVPLTGQARLIARL